MISSNEGDNIDTLINKHFQSMLNQLSKKIKNND